MEISMKLLKSKNGFTMTELLIVLAIMTILLTAGFSTFRTPKEKIACKNIYSAMQMARLRAVSTESNVYIDFDMDGGSVSENYYTIYLDTDNDTDFGEKSNANGDNEFSSSNFPMPDSWQSSGGNEFPAIALPSKTAFGLPTINPPSQSPSGGSISSGALADGVSFSGGSNRAAFNSQGSGSAGSVYIYYDNEDSVGQGCAVVKTSIGIIRMSHWNGSEWSYTW